MHKYGRKIREHCCCEFCSLLGTWIAASFRKGKTKAVLDLNRICESTWFADAYFQFFYPMCYYNTALKVYFISGA